MSAVAQASPALIIKDVSVAFRAFGRKSTTLKESVIGLLTGRRHVSQPSTLAALTNVSLSVPHGQVFSIIGSNGCGKSTLLKVIAGVLRPAKGTVWRAGEISSLIELGAGFDPELTAVENIYLHGSLHKRTRAQMAKRVNHILEFAELVEFADTPVKYFSSGMFARLGFSVAVDVNPEILLVDEILAVGDERFHARCNKVFDDLIAAGKTIILVTHDMETVKSRSHTTALLSKGRLVYCGDPATAVAMYREGSYETALHQ